MAKHLISVCIFCLICATHTPCASHVTTMSTRDALRLMDFDTPYKERLKSTHVIQDDKNTARREAALRLLAKRDVDAQQQASKHNSSNDNNNSSSNHSSSDLKIKKDLNRNELDMAQYMKKLFSTYGNGDTMTLEGFERMMDRLGLLGELSLKLDKNMSDEHKIEKSVTTAVDVERIGSQNATVSFHFKHC